MFYTLTYEQINETFNFSVPSLPSRSRPEHSKDLFSPSSYEKMSFKPLVFSFATMLLIQPMVALIKSQDKNKVKCNAVVHQTIFCNFLDIHTISCIIYHLLKDINECGLWITSPNKKEIIVLIKMDFKYKKQNVTLFTLNCMFTLSGVRQSL